MERLREFLTLAQLPDIRICYDTGHGVLQGPLPRLAGVGAIHLSDNNGDSDDHLWPFEGKLNWPEFVTELVRSGFEGPMVFEPSSPPGLEPSSGDREASREFDRRGTLLIHRIRGEIWDGVKRR